MSILAGMKKIWDKLREGYLQEMCQELGWIYRYARRYRGQIALYIALGLLAAGLGLGGSLLSRTLTTAVVGAHRAWGEVAALAAGYVLLGLVALGLSALNSRISTKVNLKIQNEMQADVFRRFLQADWSALQAFHSGDLLSRVTGDVGTVAGSVFGLLPSLVIRLFQFSACLILILWYDPVMALLALLSAPVTLLFSRALMGRMREHQKRVRGANAQLMAFHEEALQNMQAIKAFDLTGRFTAREGEEQARWREASLDFNRFSILTSSLMSLMGQAVSYTCLAWGVYRLWTGYIDLALMVMFLQLAGQLSAGFSALVGLVPGAISATVAARRILAVLDLPREPEVAPTLARRVERMAAAGRGKGLTLRLDRVSFRYAPDRPVLEEVSLLARPGELVALAGASGEGKTTLLRVLLGLIRPQGGTAILQAPGEEDLPVSACTRPLFAYVPQEKAAFSGTIAESLRLLRPDADDQMLEEALRTACAYEFVSRLPQGIHTPLGEQGAGLSEGQNQRLSIARALLRDAPGLLLDEARGDAPALSPATGPRSLPWPTGSTRSGRAGWRRVRARACFHSSNRPQASQKRRIPACKTSPSQGSDVTPC